MEHEAAEAGLDVGVESEVAKMVAPKQSNRWRPVGYNHRLPLSCGWAALYTIDAKSGLAMEPDLMATSTLYELTVSQIPDGEDDVRRKVVSILKDVSDSTIAVVSIVNKHAAPTAVCRTMKAPLVTI